MNTPRPLKVLIIEDDADARENLRDILELDDYEVSTAASVSESFDREDWPSIFAVILDRKLPDGYAEDVLPRLRQLAPSASVLIVTGHADLQTAVSAMREGAADYILKPVNPDVLRLSLARARQQQQLADEKRRSEAAFRHLVEAAGAMIVILRTDHKVIYFNPFAEELTGYRAEEVLSQDYLTRFIDPVDQVEVASEVQRNLAGHPTRNYESSIRCRDGSRRWLVWNAQRLDDFEGLPAVLAIGQDITERRKAEERALQAERLAAIGQTVTGLAHESRNAFQRSQACLELLALDLEGKPEQLELVQRIQRALDHLHRLYEEVRDYAAPIKLEKQSCDLAHLWRDAWSHLEVVRKTKEVRLKELIGNTDLTCNADWFALGQVFRNIFENAIAACPEPGEIILCCRPAKFEGRSAMEISIQDNGPGLTAESRERVFDAFFTTKTKGTGLGMAIAKRLVEAHSGTIVVGDAPGGAQFIITLPRQ